MIQGPQIQHSMVSHCYLVNPVPYLASFLTIRARYCWYWCHNITPYGGFWRKWRSWSKYWHKDHKYNTAWFSIVTWWILLLIWLPFWRSELDTADIGVITSHYMGDFDKNEDRDRNNDTRTTNTRQHDILLLPGEFCSLFGFLSDNLSSIKLGMK